MSDLTRLAELSDDAVAFATAMADHLLTCGEDLILLTLKGHLVAEHLLDTIIVRALNIPELPSYSAAKLTFFQKMKIVEAIECGREPGPNADLLRTVAKLNDIRNKLMHNLKRPSEIEALVQSVIDSYRSIKSIKGRKQDKPKCEQFRDCLCHICVFLYDIRVHSFKLRQQPNTE